MDLCVVIGAHTQTNWLLLLIVIKYLHFVGFQFNIKRYTMLLAQCFKNPILGGKHFKSVMLLW
jgi:hypothetical protein